MGKSYLTLDLAARVSRGAKWPDGQPSSIGPSSVLLLSAEDHLQYTVRPALEAAGADMSRIICPLSVREDLAAGETVRPVHLKRDLDVLEKMIKEMRGCRLVIIDPINAYLGGGGARTLDTRLFLRSLI